MPQPTPSGTASGTIRLVAFFEACKGLLVLLAGTGLLSLLHRDIPAIAERLVTHAHLNPPSRYPRIFLDAAAHVSDTRLLWLAARAAAYAALRLLEAYGLWRAAGPGPRCWPRSAAACTCRWNCWSSRGTHRRCAQPSCWPMRWWWR